jgi:adenylate cyclase
MKFLQRSMHIIGIFLIISFCAASIIFSFLERQMPAGEFKELVSYASVFENRFYDWRMMEDVKKHGKNNEIVLARLDDESLQKIGSWPVPRTTWADLLHKFKMFGAKVVAFDVIFPEEVKACGTESPDDDFAKAIKDFQSVEGNKVVLAYTTQPHQASETYAEIPEELFNFMIDSHQESDVGLYQRYVEKHTYPIQKLIDAGPDLGYINMMEDVDGVFRHYQIVSNLDTLYFPSAALKAMESFTGEPHKLEIDSQGTAKMKFGDYEFFVNNMGETKVRWFGDGYNENFLEVSIHEILAAPDNDQTMREHFNNKIIFIGSTATGAHDLRNSPIDSQMPGVYAHMNMIHMLLHQYFYKPLDESIKVTFFMMITGLVILLVVMYFNKAILDLFTVMVLTLLVVWIDQKYFLPDGYELRLFFTIFSFVASYSWVTFLNFNQASAEKKQIKGAFSRYVAPSIVNDMLDHPDKLKVGGERRDITCMFSDVRDFTSISEQLSANDLARALNRYMGEMTDIVFETNGTLDKYIGDAIVAFWGAPLDIGDHVTQAVDAGVRMLEALPAINEEFKEQGLPEFRIGLGLNSGECNVGNMGSDQIFAYTALGDTMNLGARLESSCKYYGAQILISEYTHERMDKTQFVTRLIDHVRVKGKTEPVKVYEVLYKGHHLWDDEKARKDFDNAYQLFTVAKFEEALAIFNSLCESHPEDKSSVRLKESCEHWIANPPQEGEDHTITTRTDK